MILDDYWKATLPQMSAPLEAKAFARTASASAPGYRTCTKCSASSVPSAPR